MKKNRKAPRMRNSVPAKKLASMVYCEASVTRKETLTQEDMYRMRLGEEEHLRFQKAMELRESEGKKLNGTWLKVALILFGAALILYFVFNSL